MPWDSGGLGHNSEIIMILTNRVVTQAKKQATNRLPDALTEGAILIESLEMRGGIGAIAERLCVRREGGYHGVDIVVFLIDPRLRHGCKPSLVAASPSVWRWSAEQPSSESRHEKSTSGRDPAPRQRLFTVTSTTGWPSSPPPQPSSACDVLISAIWPSCVIAAQLLSGACPSYPALVLVFPVLP